MTEKIRFSQYVKQRCREGQFASASTACNYFVWGSVYSEAPEDDPSQLGSAFQVSIKPRLFRSPEISLLRYKNGERSRWYVTNLTEQERQDVLEAWELAKEHQLVRNRVSEQKREVKRQARHWWP